MLEINNFYLVIFTTAILLFILPINTKSGIITAKISVLLSLGLITWIYVGFADINNFPDVAAYGKLESSEDFGNRDRELLTSIFLDLIQPVLPKYGEISSLFTSSIFLFALSIIFSPSIRLYRFAIFIAGPGFSPLFIQYRTFLALSLFMLLNVVFSNKRLKHISYFKFITVLVHSSLISSVFAGTVSSEKFKVQTAIMSTTIVFAVTILATYAGLYPVFSDYVPAIKMTSILFFIFCWVYVLLIDDMLTPKRLNETKLRNIDLRICKKYVYFMVLIALSTPYIALSTRFFSVHSSILLFSDSIYRNKVQIFSKESLLLLLLSAPNFLFFLSPISL